jgi:hypothetical protein
MPLRRLGTSSSRARAPRRPSGQVSLRQPTFLSSLHLLWGPAWTSARPGLDSWWSRHSLWLRPAYPYPLPNPLPHPVLLSVEASRASSDPLIATLPPSPHRGNHAADPNLASRVCSSKSPTCCSETPKIAALNWRPRRHQSLVLQYRLTSIFVSRVGICTK